MNGLFSEFNQDGLKSDEIENYSENEQMDNSRIDEMLNIIDNEDGEIKKNKFKNTYVKYICRFLIIMILYIALSQPKIMIFINEYMPDNDHLKYIGFGSILSILSIAGFYVLDQYEMQ